MQMAWGLAQATSRGLAERVCSLLLGPDSPAGSGSEDQAGDPVGVCRLWGRHPPGLPWFSLQAASGCQEAVCAQVRQLQFSFLISSIHRPGMFVSPKTLEGCLLPLLLTL